LEEQSTPNNPAFILQMDRQNGPKIAQLPR